jgi:NAD(P)H-dependent FMN reductase
VKQVLILNGSIAGKAGNTAALLKLFQAELAPHVQVLEVHLADGRPDNIREIVDSSHGFVFGSGTYWDSWGSPLQKFLEDFTNSEGSTLWLGKAAALFVTMHSVGGKAVLSRLQGVLNSFGLLFPPMSGMVYSAVSDVAQQSCPVSLQEELWQLSDIKVICHNLLQAINGGTGWKSWPIGQDDPTTRWYATN